MGTRYNLIAAQRVERLAALSDGLFAVAMTLLVVDLKAPRPRRSTPTKPCLPPSRTSPPASWSTA
jgi:uncharacterized membrane protein